jgi:hypothetical protein
MARIGLSIALGALALSCASTTVVSQRCFRYQSQNDTKEVSPGHWSGPFAWRGVCVRNLGQKNEDVGRLEMNGTFDGVWKSPTETVSCGAKSVTTIYFESGSYTDEAVSTCKPGPDGKLVFEGKGVFAKGTGAYEGIQGTTSIPFQKEVAHEPLPMNYDVAELRYSLPKR